MPGSGTSPAEAMGALEGGEAVGAPEPGSSWVQDVRVPEDLPILPNENYVLYPSMIAPLVVEEEAQIAVIDEVMKGDRIIGLFAVRPAEPAPESPAESALYDVGTAAIILKMLKMPDGTVRLLIHGLRRVRIVERVSTHPVLRARIEPLLSVALEDNETKAMMRTTQQLLRQFVQESGQPEDVVIAATNLAHPGKLADLIASNLSIPLEEHQALLELADPKQRLLKIEEILTRELEIARLGSRIQDQIKSRMDKSQREFYLREEMKAIRRELGEEEEGLSEIDELRGRIKSARMPAEIRKVAEKELARLASIPMASPEHTVARSYLGWLLALPWAKRTRETLDMERARRILDEDHYNLEKVKERILEYLAVVKLRRSLKGPILCLVGAPGTGKTSLGRSIARAMGRRFARISLGGMRDEAEIRGHRRTYIGSMPGRIIKAIKDCGTVNPVLMLDEIDKLGADFRGDPASALLEVLDPEQNRNFTDHYLDVPYDLSQVMFITTANVLDTIPGPLLDRMEVLRLSGYTLQEKLKIARAFLIPRAVEGTGLKPGDLEFTEEALERIIEGYTREAGLRNLEREIANICRKAARRAATGDRSKTRVDAAHVEAALGPRRFMPEDAGRAAVPGVAIGLAWTPAGGELLFIEATSTPGDGRLILTGQLGDIMKESAQAAMTCLLAQRRALGIDPARLKGRNFHIHVPAGATPKDGPSAGVAILMALASLAREQPIRAQTAMTGEITLKGSILAVGGIKEKVLAAHRSGIRRIILPKLNERDLSDVPDEIRQSLHFHLVDRAEEAFAVSFPDARPQRPPARPQRRPRARGSERRRRLPPARVKD